MRRVLLFFSLCLVMTGCVFEQLFPEITHRDLLFPMNNLLATDSAHQRVYVFDFKDTAFAPQIDTLKIFTADGQLHAKRTFPNGSPYRGIAPNPSDVNSMLAITRDGDLDTLDDQGNTLASIDFVPMGGGRVEGFVEICDLDTHLGTGHAFVSGLWHHPSTGPVATVVRVNLDDPTDTQRIQLPWNDDVCAVVSVNDNTPQEEFVAGMLGGEKIFHVREGVIISHHTLSGIRLMDVAAAGTDVVVGDGAGKAVLTVSLDTGAIMDTLPDALGVALDRPYVLPTDTQVDLWMAGFMFEGIWADYRGFRIRLGM
ncbi:MAG: hypothetical protein ACE366_01810 [Bradymonadia bacterium]